jgi:hypothetical protein
MRPLGFERLAVVALAAACASGCTPEPNVDAQRQPAPNAAAAAHAPTLQNLRRVAPLSLDDRAAWRSALDWPASCEDAFESSRAGQDGGLVIHALEPNVSLVEVLCASGAYQPSHVFLRFDERGSSPVATLLEFRVFLSADGAALTTSLETEIWGEPTLSPGARELSVLTLSRQLADCGVWSRHAIGSGSDRPQLLAAAEQLPCPPTPGPPAESADGNAPRGWRPIRLSK